MASLTDHAQAFGRDIANRRGASMIMVSRQETGISIHVGIPKTGSEQAVKALSDAVGARATKVDSFPEIIPKNIAIEHAVGNVPAGRDKQDTETTIVAERLSASLVEVGSWAAVTFRRAKGKEIRRERRWILAYYGAGATSTHHAMSAGALVMTIYTGAPNRDNASSLLSQVAGVLPGFDVSTKARRINRMVPAWMALGLGVAIGLFVKITGLANGAHGWWWSGMTVSPFTLVGIGMLTAFIPTKASRIEKALLNGNPLPRPPKRLLAPLQPKQANLEKPQRWGGSYPLHRDSFLVGAHLPAMFASPHAGSGSNARQIVDKEPPPDLVERCGPLIGESAGLPLHLALDDSSGGRVFIGAPSSGKSILVRLLWGYDILERGSPSGLPGSVGPNNTLVAFESKGEGALAYIKWAHRLEHPVYLVDLGNPQTAAIDMFAGPMRVADQAALFVNAMRYGFGESAIQDRSTAVLSAVLTAALVITPEIALAAGIQPGSVMWYSHILLGAHGDEIAKRLVAQIERGAIEAEKAASTNVLGAGSTANPFEAMDPEKDLLVNPLTDLGMAASKIEKFFTMTAASRANEFAAARNKIDQLVEAESWFSPTRPKLTWDRILNDNMVIVVNTGSPTPGENNEQVGQKLTETMGAMLLFTLREAIARNCAGWYDQGRAVSIYADELSQVAATGPEVVEWLREQARQRGVRLTFATQRPEQLSERLRACVMGFSTVGWMKTTNPQVIRFASEDLSIADDEWSPSTVASIPNYHVAIRTGRSGRRLPPALAKVHYFEDKTGKDFVDAQRGIKK